MNLLPLPKLKPVWTNDKEETNNDQVLGLVPPTSTMVGGNSTSPWFPNSNRSIKVVPSLETVPASIDTTNTMDAQQTTPVFSFYGSGDKGTGTGSGDKGTGTRRASASSIATLQEEDPPIQNKYIEVPQTTPRTFNVRPQNYNESAYDYVEQEFSKSSSKFARKKEGCAEDSNEISKDDLEFSERFPRGNCLFAAGSTIPKAFIASLFSMAYYTPGFLELIEALLNPGRYDQSSTPALFNVIFTLS